MERRGVVPGTPGDCGTVGPSERQCQGACCFPTLVRFCPQIPLRDPAPSQSPRPLMCSGLHVLKP